MGKSAVPKQKRGRGGRQDIGVVDRALSWMKNNEKVLLVILLLLIAPIFFVPGAFQSFMSTAGGVPAMKIDGEVIYTGDIRMLKETMDGIRTLRGRPDFSDPKAFRRWYILASVTDFELPVLEREADRQGIVVSRAELGAEVLRVYRQLKLVKEEQENSLARRLDVTTPQFNYQERQDELEAQNAWNHSEWRTLLREIAGNNPRIPSNLSQPRLFEYELRRVMRLDKLVEFVMDTVEVDENAIREQYVRDQQFRKFSFFWLEPTEDEVAAKAAEGVADQDLEDFFKDDPELFRVRQAVGRADYLFIPFSSFEDKVEISDEDIQKEYEATRGQKFRRGLADEDLGAFPLRTAKEQEAREERLYKPLAEVREDVIEALTEKKKKRLARNFGNELRRRIFPVGVDKDGVAFDELVKEYPNLEAGTTPMMQSSEARDELGKHYASSIATAFSTLTKNASQEDELLHRGITLSKLFTETTDSSGLVLYKDFRHRLPGLPDFDDIRDEVKEEFGTKRALDGMEEGAEALLERLRTGAASFEEAAKAEAATVHPVPFIRRTDSVSIAVADDEADKTESSEADDEPEKKTEPVPSQEARVITDEVFNMAVDDSEKKVSFARDDKAGKYVFVRLEGTLDPDENGYQEWRSRSYDGIVAGRQVAYFQTWKSRLRTILDVQFVARSQPTPEEQELEPVSDNP